MQLSVAHATSNGPEDILKAYSKYNGNRVVAVPGVGRDAAAAFYKSDDGRESRVTLLARNANWSIDLRSYVDGDEGAADFKALADLAGRALARLDADQEFARLRKR